VGDATARYEECPIALESFSSRRAWRLRCLVVPKVIGFAMTPHYATFMPVGLYGLNRVGTAPTAIAQSQENLLLYQAELPAKADKLCNIHTIAYKMTWVDASNE
jgi:hypothetical protein